MQKAQLTCERLRAEGKGRFEVEVVRDVPDYIRVTRWAEPDASDIRWRQLEAAES